MNNAFNYQNDLTGFRSQLSEITTKHDNAVSNARAVAVGGKARLIQKAKDLKEAGDSLVKQGLEAEIVPTAGAAIFKGGKALYSRLSAPSQGGATNTGVDAPQTTTDGTNVTSRVGDATTDTGDAADSSIQTLKDGRRVARTIARPAGQGGGAADQQGSELMEEKPTIRGFKNATQDGGDPYGNEQPQGETKEGGDEEGDIGGDAGDAADAAGDAAGDALSSAADAGADALSSAVGGVGDAAATAASAAGDAAAAAISGASDLAGSAAAAASGTAEGLSGAASGLAEAAGATSWIPFIGEVVGGVAALAALGAAGYGAYEEIKGAINEGTAEATKVVPKQVAPADVTGSFIAPQQSSQEE